MKELPILKTSCPFFSAITQDVSFTPSKNPSSFDAITASLKRKFHFVLLDFLHPLLIMKGCSRPSLKLTTSSLQSYFNFISQHCILESKLTIHLSTLTFISRSRPVLPNPQDSGSSTHSPFPQAH